MKISHKRNKVAKGYSGEVMEAEKDRLALYPLHEAYNDEKTNFNYGKTIISGGEMSSTRWTCPALS
jgi:hypothetical protein